jgi:UrcA family protein
MLLRPARAATLAAVALALFAAAAPAFADTAADGPVVRVSLAALHSVSGQADMRRQLKAAADAYCRGNPTEGRTVFECRTDLTAALERDLTARTGIALQDQGLARLASK